MMNTRSIPSGILTVQFKPRASQRPHEDFNLLDHSTNRRKIQLHQRNSFLAKSLESFFAASAPDGSEHRPGPQRCSCFM